MACCWAEEHPENAWCSEYDIVYEDEETGKEYCVFHAPKEHKGVGKYEINQLVLNKIKEARKDSKLCDLSGTIFSDKIVFGEYERREQLPYILFDECIFNGEVLFSNVLLNRPIHFNEVKIEGEFHIYNCTIKNAIVFSHAIFAKYISIMKTDIIDIIRFENTDFMNRLRLLNINLDGQLIFQDTKHFGKVLFTNMYSKGNCDLLDCQFQKHIDISKISINHLSVEKCIFNNTISIKRVSPSTSIVINSDDMTKIEFGKTEVDKLHFEGCIWPKDAKLYHELNADNSLFSLKMNEEIYCALKQKFLKGGDQPMVGVWHFREKINAMKQIPLWRRLFTATFWYWACSGFGERPVRAFLFLLFLAVFPFLILGYSEMLQGLQTGQFDTETIDQIVKKWLHYLPFTKAITGSADKATGWEQFRMLGSQLLITIQAGLAGFALRNRFRRS